MIKVIDVETGGLNPETDALMSIAIITLDEDLNVKSEFYTLVRDFGKQYRPEALAVNGINMMDIDSAPSIEEVKDEILERLWQKDILCFHDAVFDAKWLNVKFGYDIQNAIDTIILSEAFFPSQKRRLSELIKRCGFAVENAHNALGDARMTAKALKWFYENKNKVSFDVLSETPIAWDKWKDKK